LTVIASSPLPINDSIKHDIPSAAGCMYQCATSNLS
jgi:hypothetical protein